MEIVHIFDGAWDETLCGEFGLRKTKREPNVLVEVCENCSYIARIRSGLKSKESNVDPLYIVEQRESGWPDIHPEDYCHMCGRENPLWYAERDAWQQATKKWSEITGQEGICCPTCFLKMFSDVMPGNWIMKITLERLDKPTDGETNSLNLAQGRESS